VTVIALVLLVLALHAMGVWWTTRGGGGPPEVKPCRQQVLADVVRAEGTPDQAVPHALDDPALEALAQRLVALVGPAIRKLFPGGLPGRAAAG
jgi:hypothetical protein